MEMPYTSVPMEPIRPRPAASRRRTGSATRIATGWTATWHGLQQGSRLQAGSISELQISIISLGGVIGAGLLLGSGTALSHAGPGGIVVIAMGSHLIEKIIPNVYTQEALDRTYYICISLSIIVTACASLVGPRYYARLETFFSVVKICTLIWATILCFVLASKQEAGFFRYWRDPGAFAQYCFEGALGRFLAICSVQLQACFGFFGTEVAVMVAAEVRRPEVSIPAVARKVWLWIFVFHIAGVFGPGLLVPHNLWTPSVSGGFKADISSSSLPFLIAFDGAESKAGAAAAVLFALAAFSAALTNIFISSRLLFFLSKCGHAPEWCSKVINMPFALGRVPVAGVLITSAFGTLAYIAALDGLYELFDWLSTVAATAALGSWIGMLVTYLKWIQGIETAVSRAENGELAFQIFVAKYGERFPTGRVFAKLRAWYALLMCSAILLSNEGWVVFTIPNRWIIAETLEEHEWSYRDCISPMEKPAATFVSSYLTIPSVLLLFYGYKLINRTRAVTFEEMAQNMAHEWDEQLRVEEQERRDRDEHPEWRAHQPGLLHRFVHNCFTLIFSRNTGCL